MLHSLTKFISKDQLSEDIRNVIIMLKKLILINMCEDDELERKLYEKEDEEISVDDKSKIKQTLFNLENENVRFQFDQQDLFKNIDSKKFNVGEIITKHRKYKNDKEYKNNVEKHVDETVKQMYNSKSWKTTENQE